MKKIIVIGSANIDLVYEVDQIPSIGESIHGRNLVKYCGGKGLNQAVASSRLDMETHFLGSVGSGSDALSLLDYLKSEPVIINNLLTSKQTTGTAIISLINNDNTIVVIPGANDDVSIEYIKENQHLFDQDSIVLIQNEIKQEVNEYIIDYCYQNNIDIVYNPAPARLIFEDLLNKVTYFTPNETEAKAIFNTEDLESIVLKYPNKVIITLGKDGIMYAQDNKVIVIPTLKVDVKDSTGAGDTFNGILVAALANNYDLNKALKKAVYGASLSTQKQGAQTGMPKAKELEDEKIWNFK